MILEPWLGGIGYEIYTWPYCCFIWYHWILSIGINFDISCILIYLYVCMLSFQRISIPLVSTFHTYIYVLVVLTISLYLKAQILFMMISLSFNLVSIDLVFNWYLIFKPYHSFYWYFIKGEKNLYFIFQLVFSIPLPCFMIENNNFNWYLIP